MLAFKEARLPVHMREPQGGVDTARPAGRLEGKRPRGRSLPPDYRRQLVEVACSQARPSASRNVQASSTLSLPPRSWMVGSTCGRAREAK